MRHPRSFLLTLAAAIVVAACGSASATPTPTPAGAGGGGGGNATQATGGGGGGGGSATQAPGGGGGGSKPAGWDKYGKVSYQVSGPVTAGGELGFVPAGSVFAGNQISMSFFDDGSQTLVALRLDGSTAFAQYGDGKITFTSDQCTTKDLKVQGTTASGSFDCTGAALTESGAIVTGARMTGSFTGHP